MHITNQCLRGEGYNGKNRSVQCLHQLMNFDIEVGEPSWQAHINGCLAYTKHVGGVRAATCGPRSMTLLCHVML